MLHLGDAVVGDSFDVLQCLYVRDVINRFQAFVFLPPCRLLGGLFGITYCSMLVIGGVVSLTPPQRFFRALSPRMRHLVKSAIPFLANSGLT